MVESGSFEYLSFLRAWNFMSGILVFKSWSSSTSWVCEVYWMFCVWLVYRYFGVMVIFKKLCIFQVVSGSCDLVFESWSLRDGVTCGV